MTTLYMGSSYIYQTALTHMFRHRSPKSFICKSMTKTTPEDASVDVRRRSGNYQPSPWDHRYLLSIDNTFSNQKEQKVIARDSLKTKVKTMLDVETKSLLEKLELIDELQKLGVSYHFEVEIRNVLTEIYQKNGRNVRECNKEEDLHAISLEFRLLRQHGFDVKEDIFDVLVDKIESDTFENDDINSIITLYESSYLSTKSDTKLQKIIKPFAIDQLKRFIDSHNEEDIMREMVMHALEMPYHWRMRRLEMRWYIDAYQKKHDMSLVLDEFAKIDFNIVQIAHQEDLKHVSRWWKETCICKELPFARDRIVENFFWSIGLKYEPEFGYIRRTMTKVLSLLTTIDDVYDIYGTVEELELFTSMLDNWDLNRLDELPKYLRFCFLLLDNEINDIGNVALKYNNIDVTPFLKKSWTDLCKTFLVEAKWYARGYIPSMEEYMQNAWISVSGPTILINYYSVSSDQISTQVLEILSQYGQEIIRGPSTILRLANDLATSSDEVARGDVLKSVQCYMHQTGTSEDKARAHVHQMISDTWEEMNYETKTANSSPLLTRNFVEAAMNLARMSQCIYQYGDGHGSPAKAKTVERCQSLLFNQVV